MKKKVVVLVNGCWDPYHWGHLQHFKAAREMGDELVASVTHDDQVRLEKGEGRPLLSHVKRAEVLQSLRIIDWTVVVESAVQAIQVVKPDIFVKGPDYIGRISPEVAEACKDLRVKIAFTRAPKLSATLIGNELRRRQ